MSNLAIEMPSTYNLWLVLLSFAVAILVSYTALSLAARVAAAPGTLSKIWLAGGSVTMGIGIWAMHFIGMLAFSLPIALRYDLPRTFESLALAIATSAGALWIASGEHLSTRRLAAGAVLMGSGIAGMHYLGMSAIRIVPSLSYDTLYLGASIAIAVVASFTALWLAFNLRSGNSKRLTLGRLAAAVLMGLAIGGMHYTGMAAARFGIGAFCVGGVALDSNWLAAVVGALTVGLLSITLLTAIFDDHLRARLSSEAKRLEATNRELLEQVSKTKLAMRDLEHVHYALDHLAAVAVTDVDGAVTSVNDRFCEMSGFSRDEILGKTLSAHAGTHLPESYENLLKTVSSGTAWHGELWSEKKTGERYWVDLAVVPYKEENGSISQYVTIRTDITQRKQAIDKLATQEQRSRDSEERLRQIADSIPAMISYWGTDLVCQFANQAYHPRYGLTAAQIVGMSFADLFKNEVDADRDARVQATLRGERQLFDNSTVSPDGQTRHWLGEYLPHREHDRVVGFFILVLEITERRQAEERIARQDALLATTSRIGEIGGWEVNQDHELPATSPILATILGYLPDHKLTFEQALHHYPADARAQMRECIDAALLQGIPFDQVTPFVTVSGQQRWGRSIGEPQESTDGSRRVVGALQDITRYKELEASLVQAQKLESIGHLSAGIAHEINTPTQFIGDNVSFLQGSAADLFLIIAELIKHSEAIPDPGERAVAMHAVLQQHEFEYLQTEIPLAISQSAEGIHRIRKIVSAMKEFSHPATDKTPTDINRAIESTVIVASNEWKYVADVQTDFDPALALVTVMPGSFNQVILNIIVNAAHAIAASIERGLSKKGTIVIATRRCQASAEIRISDTGCGMPEAVKRHIFDPFFTTKPVGKGTGQGLFIAHDVIVKNHGGSIRVESEEGKGSTFIICLPMQVDTVPGSAAA